MAWLGYLLFRAVLGERASICISDVGPHGMSNHFSVSVDGKPARREGLLIRDMSEDGRGLDLLLRACCGRASKHLLLSF